MRYAHGLPAMSCCTCIELDKAFDEQKTGQSVDASFQNAMCMLAVTLAQASEVWLPRNAGTRASSIHASAFATFTGRQKDNSVWVCGLNTYGQLGA